MSSFLPPHYSLRWRRVILAAVLLYLAWLGWNRFSLALADRDLLTELGVSPGSTYLMLYGALWFLAGVTGAVLCFVRPRAAFVAVCLLALTGWADFLIFTRPAELMGGWPFMLIYTVLGLLYSAWACAWLVRKEVLADGRTE
ncbi:MAG: hypothetical protein HY835_07810 [Anaerolineae bacterium]|nr:hypothetical protein [Anaerolineae bacterium]